MLQRLLCLLLGYLCGCFLTAELVARARTGKSAAALGTGNPGMAKGGSGDVLSGILLSFLGQGMPPRLAVPMAVCIHGMAGDLCAEELGEYGMTPRDMVDALPRVLKALEGRRGAPNL